jgi:hypothetical protein
MNLSPHFSLAEFCTSQIAARTGRVIEPTDSDIANLVRLCETVLEPLREALQRPIHISSGYRPLWLNQAIGGSSTSAHMEGRAADVEVPGMTPLEVCRRVATLGLPVDQCIFEFGQWTHLGVAKDGEAIRNQFWTAHVLNGRTVYSPGVNA